jgi:hypothetical protein
MFLSRANCAIKVRPVSVSHPRPVSVPQTELVVRMTMPGGGQVASTLSVRAIVKWQNEQTGRRRTCYRTGAQFM